MQPSVECNMLLCWLSKIPASIYTMSQINLPVKNTEYVLRSDLQNRMKLSLNLSLLFIMQVYGSK